MGFRCHWCFASWYTNPYACTLHCGHSICTYCYQTPPPCCVACQPKLTSEADGGAPGQAWETRFGPSAPEENGCQNPTAGTEGKSDVNQIAHNIEVKLKMGNSCFGPQQREQGSDTWQSGTIGKVSRLRRQFETGGTTAQEGATWKAHNPEKDSRATQGNTNLSGQQDSLVRMQDPQYAPLNIPSSSPPSEGQRPQHRRLHSRGTPPYPPIIPTKDAYLSNTGTRETMACPSGTTNTFPSTSDRNPSPSSSSSSPSISHTNPSRSSSRTREPSPSPLNARSHSRSSSRDRNPPPSSPSSSFSIQHINPSHSSSRTRDPSPSSVNVRSRPRSSSSNRDSSSSHHRGRISSPSPVRHTNHSRSSSSPRDPSRPSSRHSSLTLSPSGSRKSSPTPSKATEPSTAPPHSSGAMFPDTHSKGGHAKGATSHHSATHEPQLKQALTPPISTEGRTFLRTHRLTTATMTRGMQLNEQEQWRMEEKGLQGELKVWQEKGVNLQHNELKRGQETQKLTDEGLANKIDTMQQSVMKLDGMLELKKEMLDRKEAELACLKTEYDKQQKKIIELEEKDHEHQDELAKLRELSLAQHNLVQELATQREQMKALTQENTELKEKVASLGKAKDAQEKEASHWKAEYDKQRAATEKEMRQFKVQESNRLQKDYDRWVLKMTEMQNKVAAKEGEISQYIGKYNHLQNELQRVQEEWIKSKGEASILSMENAQHQKEKVKYEQEVRDLKQEMSAKCIEWEEERNLYTENLTVLGEKVDSVEKQNLSLLKKEQEYQAALRRSKDDNTCLISERNSCQEEIKKLTKDKETLKENMAQLRRERDDHQMKLHALENRPLQSPRLTEQISTVLLGIDKLKRREAKQQEEATQLRQERDNSKEEADQLKRKEETEVTRLRQERDGYKEEADQLKRRAETEVTQLRQERDKYKEEADQLKWREGMEVTRLREERDKYKGEADQLKRRAETMIAPLHQERDKYKEDADHIRRKAESELNQMSQERDNYKEDADQIRRKAESKLKQMSQERDQYKEDADQIRRKAESKLKQMSQERDQYKEDADHIRRKAESELIQMSQERDKYKEEVNKLNRRPGSYQEKASELNRAESKKITELQQERDDLKRQVDGLTWRENTQIQQIRGERDKYKQEVDHLKSKEATWEKQMADLKRERDEYKESAGQLQMVPERGSSRNREDKGDGVKAEAGPRGDTQPNRDLGNIQVPSTYPQPHASRVAEEEEVVVTQGLPNLGNTCYINSVVQCLYHLLPLRNTLHSNISRLYYQPGTRVALTLAEHFVAMQNASEREVCLTTGALKRVLGSYDASFGGREQQEAHDLFTALVSCLQSDLSQHDGPDMSPSASSLFGGQLETSMVCLETFAPLTHTSEAFTSLSLPVVGSNTWKLKDLLDKHFREQKMDWDCEHCHFTHKCSHSTHIRRCPPLLVIHFSRVSHFNSTWKTKVKFPVAGLSLQSYVAQDAPRSPQYQLVGVVCHVGSMASGHYTAYCRYRRGRRSRKWRLCNDSQVWDVEEWRVLEDETAHMLFYVQQGS